MARAWYILQTYSGYEQRVQRALSSMLEEQNLDSAVVLQVKVPTERVTEIVAGRRRERSVRILPGYVMLEMDLPVENWKATCQAIRGVQGVAGFVGAAPGERPRPISSDEAKNILTLAGELKGTPRARVRGNFSVGEVVKITAGPFAQFNGAVEELDLDKGKVKVSVQIFGRNTPVEVDITQIEKI